MISSTWGAKRPITHCTIGLPCSSCRPLSTLPMRRPWPPARTMPLTWLMETDFTSKLRAMNKNRFLVPFLNLGHFLDHLVMLVFPTVVIALARDWGRPYAELLPLALGGFIAFGAFALPAGWLADHWSRYRMMALFFFGIGAALFLTGFAGSAWQIGLGLALTGMFAAIYHPVGIAMLVAAPAKLGSALGWNGLWGNLGLAAAAIVSGALMDLWGRRAGGVRLYPGGVRAAGDGLAHRPLRAAAPDDRHRADPDPAARAGRQPAGLGDARRGAPHDARGVRADSAQRCDRRQVLRRRVPRARLRRALCGDAERRRSRRADDCPASPHRRRLQERVPRAGGAGRRDAARLVLLPFAQNDYRSSSCLNQGQTTFFFKTSGRIRSASNSS